ncbi:hypothetical protein LTR08_005919 [Meristemomyces frigidus]|nr:hypothetical protein LTR08_005919 [Meristemomyces frigidus]
MAGTQSPGDDYFNDLSQQPARQDDDQHEQRRGSQENGDQTLKPKRIACVLCRKRKLRCDTAKPSCGTCIRLQHECTYDEVRRKSGPKRGYVKALEARLAQVETMLKTQDVPPSGDRNGNPNGQATAAQAARNMMPDFQDVGIGNNHVDLEQTINPYDGPAQAHFAHTTPGSPDFGHTGVLAEDPFPWEMISLGLDEPLPTHDVVNELNQAYFEKIHPSVPMIHRPRYYAAMNLAPHMRPPVCLRYAMWCNAAAVTDKYEALQEHFYERARKYIQQDEMKGHGEGMITLAHCQTWALLCNYEFKLMMFPRAWMSSGRASRMVQMMGLHRLAGSGLEVKQCLPPPRDWTEMEERRRTFWMGFCMDRYSSIGTGWPMTLEEKDISTTLPSDEASYEQSRPGKAMSLEDALNPACASNLSSFAGVVLLACLFGRNLLHLHRPTPDDNDEDLNGEFWKRHRHIDNILLNTALALPDALRLPNGLNDPNVVFLNMNIHTSTICLHQAAIFKADKVRMPSRVSAESKVRCITAAAEIASVMRQISHLDLSAMNPFISFCLYVAARVFVQYLKSRPKDEQVRANLDFLLSAMHAIKRKNPLTESFLVQLEVDLEGAGLDDARSLRVQAPANRAPACPTQHLGMQPTSGDCAPTYGDQGLSAYNNPNQTVNIVGPHSDPADAFAYATGNISEFVGGSPAFELPSRLRAQTSNDGSYMHRNSQSSHDAEMDTSPDGSGGRPTPSSTNLSQHNASSHTSHTGRSPESRLPDQQACANPELAGIAGIFNPNNSSAYNTDFDSFTASATGDQQSGFVLPQGWAPGTGLTPGPSGLTPGGGMGDMAAVIGMSDADWNQVLDGFPTWDPVMEVETQHQ